jgi:hypothetical protein
MAMNEQSRINPTAHVFDDEIAMAIFTEWQMEHDARSAKNAVRWCDVPADNVDNSPVFFLNTNLDSSNDARERGAAFGFEVQILFPCDDLPSAGRALIVALDELLLDLRERREYLAWLKSQTLPLPTVVLSYDFHLEPPTVVRPGLMVACLLNDEIFRALRDGHIYSPVAESANEEHNAA